MVNIPECGFIRFTNPVYSRSAASAVEMVVKTRKKARVYSAHLRPPLEEGLQSGGETNRAVRGMRPYEGIPVIDLWQAALQQPVTAPFKSVILGDCRREHSDHDACMTDCQIPVVMRKEKEAPIHRLSEHCFVPVTEKAGSDMLPFLSRTTT